MKKILFKTVFIILIFLPIIAVAHLLVFPQETRCILIDLDNFKKQQNVYYRIDVSANTIEKILQVKSDAEKKVLSFWRNTQFKYKLIYCEDSVDFAEYGRPNSPAVTNMKFSAYVVVSKDMFDENVIAHEISHTVLYKKLGWYKLHFKIPTWFDEGLAMQVDERPYYSIDSLLKNKVSPNVLSGIIKMDTPGNFYTGTLGNVVMNYTLSKYIVYEWLKKNPLTAFINSLNHGNSFSNALL